MSLQLNFEILGPLNLSTMCYVVKAIQERIEEDDNLGLLKESRSIVNLSAFTVLSLNMKIEQL